MSDVSAGHGKPCALCDRLCDALHGNPSFWPVCLPVDGQSVWHHAGCVVGTMDSLRALVAKYEKRLEIDHVYEQIPKEERVARDPITGRLEWLRPRITTPEEREHMPDKILALEIGEVFLLELIRDAYNAVKDIHGFDPDLLECLRFHAWKADERDRSHAKEEDDEADPGKEPSEGA
jgi:hypothetical protein